MGGGREGGLVRETCSPVGSVLLPPADPSGTDPGHGQQSPLLWVLSTRLENRLLKNSFQVQLTYTIMLVLGAQHSD